MASDFNQRVKPASIEEQQDILRRIKDFDFTKRPLTTDDEFSGSQSARQNRSNRSKMKQAMAAGLNDRISNSSVERGRLTKIVASPDTGRSTNEAEETKVGQRFEQARSRMSEDAWELHLELERQKMTDEAVRN